ncbi:unnamed protein product [Moneuplotes crassus]|uniref:Uncharacterized protein n=1 Tax=Euplotes crassus TaxID=5936 RepID=A0AAD1UIF0_EUPCR|nr:unnamed protein product [Moneuplotes crassus]
MKCFASKVKSHAIGSPGLVPCNRSSIHSTVHCCEFLLRLPLIKSFYCSGSFPFSKESTLLSISVSKCLFSFFSRFTELCLLCNELENPKDLEKIELDRCSPPPFSHPIASAAEVKFFFGPLTPLFIVLNSPERSGLVLLKLRLLFCWLEVPKPKKSKVFSILRLFLLPPLLLLTLGPKGLESV